MGQHRRRLPHRVETRQMDQFGLRQAFPVTGSLALKQQQAQPAATRACPS
jgi:hypothetical protein